MCEAVEAFIQGLVATCEAESHEARSVERAAWDERDQGFVEEFACDSSVITELGDVDQAVEGAFGRDRC